MDKKDLEGVDWQKTEFMSGTMPNDLSKDHLYIMEYRKEEDLLVYHAADQCDIGCHDNLASFDEVDDDDIIGGGHAEVIDVYEDTHFRKYVDFDEESEVALCLYGNSGEYGDVPKYVLESVEDKIKQVYDVCQGHDIDEIARITLENLQDI